MSTRQHRPATDSGTLTLGGDLHVYRLGYGAMRITGEGVWGPPAHKNESLAVLKRVLELGINLIDTADSYGPNVSEELIAEALYPYPKDLVIATKGGLLRTGPGQWPQDGRPEHLREALEGSLKRLRVDQIDIYQFHRPDPKVPFEDSIGELARLKEQGKIRHVGVSNVTIEQLAQAQKIVPIVTVQNHYNLVKRQSENMTVAQSEELIDICARQGIGFIPWFPLATGDLARPGSVLEQIAQKHHAQPSQIALAWLLKRSPTILPIPGTSSIKHLEENVLGATIQLSQEEFDSIDQNSKQQQSK
ncbi:aldo/keto reductase [Tengunoibacter tsumagoiensis]|uniref:Oxidoreductase n=1 Tax=Tengunoibacter tsumagoiensis TaxID=2014871 RepID=A0A401ZZC0_9CHLR|nr:aldo/keto reductase [Tengunoibacter tsumagoiensis]GCE12198.1 oxidoreductase [Tengunoibacter tsumagoiensis]